MAALTMCPACAESAERVSHSFRPDCRGCCARAISRGPNFREAKHAGRQTPKYRGELAQFSIEHAEVVAAAAVDRVGK